MDAIMTLWLELLLIPPSFLVEIVTALDTNMHHN